MRFQIEHRIGVQAPASQVWRHLADLPAWSEWNPIYPEISGRLQIGAPLTLREAAPGGGHEALTVTVVDWVPDSQIVWTGKAAGGLVRRTRYLEIQTLTETGSVFSNGELYEGFAARFIPRPLRRERRAQFARMGEALKARVEADAGGDPAPWPEAGALSVHEVQP